MALAMILAAASGWAEPALTARVPGGRAAAEYVAAAALTDPSIAARRAALDAARASLAALSPSAVVLSLGSGSMALSGSSTIGAEPSIAAAPWVEATLGGQSPATLRLSAPLSLALGAAGSAGAASDAATGSPSLAPRLEIKQSLERLGRPDLARLRAERALREAEEALDAAAIASAKRVLAALRDWAGAETALASARSAAEAAARNLSNAITLRQYRQGSAALARLEHADLAARLAVDKAERALERRRAAVAALAGLEPTGAAPEPPRTAFPDLSRLRAEDSRAYRRGLEALALDRLAHEDEWGAVRPKPSWTGSLAYLPAGTPISGSTIGGSSTEPSLEASLGATVDWGSLAAAAGLSWTAGRPSAGLSLSWIPGDEAVKAARREAAEATLRASELVLEETLAQARAELEDLLLEASLADVEARRLEAAYGEARLAVEETEALEREGLASLAELDEAREELYKAAAALETAAWNAATDAIGLAASWDLDAAGGRS